MKSTSVIMCLIPLLLLGCSDPVLEDSQEECARVGGDWITFSNGCVDSCSYHRSNEVLMCSQAFVDSCSCGEDMCWTGRTCEEIDQS